MRVVTSVLLGLLLLVVKIGVAADEPGLSVGTIAPDFSESVSDNENIVLSELYAKSPVVLVFYRGGWCKFCNIQLQEYQQRIEDFKSAGIEVIAVSIDSKETAADYKEKQQLDFNVIGNPQGDLIKDYNVTFYVPRNLARKYKHEFNIDLYAASGREDGLIAVPATYVINTEGLIVYSEADINYRVRPKIDDVLEAAKQAKPAQLSVQ